MVLISIWLGIDGVNPICYETIKVCDPLDFHVRSIGVTEGTIHAPTIRWHNWRASIVLILLR